MITPFFVTLPHTTFEPRSSFPAIEADSLLAVVCKQKIARSHIIFGFRPSNSSSRPTCRQRLPEILIKVNTIYRPGVREILGKKKFLGCWGASLINDSKSIMPKSRLPLPPAGSMSFLILHSRIPRAALLSIRVRPLGAVPSTRRCPTGMTFFVFAPVALLVQIKPAELSALSCDDNLVADR